MTTIFPLDCFKDTHTPFYFYDAEMLNRTLQTLQREAGKHDAFTVHYAVKANANRRLLRIVKDAGLGADCVSGGEIEAALAAGFPADKIVFAGVGKNDAEIELALQHDIFCFNVESIAELEVINDIAAREKKTAQLCFRINPEVGAHTHAKIATGGAENKFGIAMKDLDGAIALANEMKHVRCIGLHFHIGSQILNLRDFENLCERINNLQDVFEARGIFFEHINVGGGLGVDYNQPDAVPPFKAYFDLYAKHLKRRAGQRVHFELGRSVVAQCGTLVSRVLYVKSGVQKQFLVLDAGMTDLLRPALYHAHHCIENISAADNEREETYDVVGPICESSDVFGEAVNVRRSRRGDLIAIRSAGAYGEAMASQYNCRQLPKSYLSTDFNF